MAGDAEDTSLAVAIGKLEPGFQLAARTRNREGLGARHGAL